MASEMLLDEYNALRDGRGFVALKEWSSVVATGKDRQTFLHSFCTNDVKRLRPGESCEAFFTNVKGKILGQGLVTCREEEVVIVGPPGQAAALVSHLDRYIIREDVQLRDTTAERSYLLSSAPVVDLPGYWLEWDLIGRVGSGLLEIAADALDRTCETLVGEGAVCCHEPAFNALRIEAGVPLFGVDFGADNLPQEIGRDDRAISFTKGCYLGQETVARIDALGHVNQRIAGVRFASTVVPPAGTELTHEGVAAGHVTSAAHSPRLGAPLALAMVRRASLAVGSRMESVVGECEVVALPVV